MADHAPAILGPAIFSRKGIGTPSFQLEFASKAHYVIEIATDPQLFDQANAGTRRADNFYQTPVDQLLGPVTTSVFILPAAAWRSLRGAVKLYYRVITSSAADALTDVGESASPDNGAAVPYISLTDDVLQPQPRVAAARRYGISGT